MTQRKADKPMTETSLQTTAWSTAAVAKTDDAAPAEMGAILSMAVEKNVPVETLERVVALYERMADRKAAQDFAQALAEFQETCPSIPKTSTAKFTTRGGSTMTYNYAELDTIAHTVGPLLHKRGLSYSWDSEIKEKTIHCTCTLRHANGHSVSASFSCPTESASAMNEQQKVAASLTYARRQSLIQVLGLTTTEPDSDGNVSDHDTITESQAADLLALADEVGADKAKIMNWLGVSSAREIRTRDYSRAMKALEAKRGGK